MKRFVLFLFLTSISVLANAQVDELRKQFDEFRRQAMGEYENFRVQANQQYADFLRKAWEKYEALPAVPKPKDEKVPPVVMPEEEKDKLLVDNPLPIDSVIVPPAPKPQPEPVSPIVVRPEVNENYVRFLYCGTECKVRFDGVDLALDKLDLETLSSSWKRLADGIADKTIVDCLQFRSDLQLCDWAYLNMLQAMAEACLGKTDAATFLMAYVYCQSGYRMRLGIADGHLYMLYASEHSVYGQPFYEVDGERFYPFGSDKTRMSICGASFPDEKPLSLFINAAQKIAYARTAERTLTAKRYPSANVTLSVNKNAIDFYNSYPISKLEENFMTKWTVYGNMPLSTDITKPLYGQLRHAIEGKSQLESANILLNWVQTAFKYEYDDVVWGYDRPFFAEETLYYPYCDCEDRAVLFSRIVRDMLGLDVVLVYYPGHLASAVCFTDNVPGDYITLNGKKFVIADPTYIGAPIGRTMPDMDNKAATVILLKK